MSGTPQEIHDLTVAIGEYSGTAPVKLMVDLLDQLKAFYAEGLIDVEPDALKFKQGAIKQVMALRMALVSKTTFMPLV